MRNWHAERNWGSLRGMTTSNKLTQFRTRLYSILPGRGDAAMDLIDALSSNLTARSVVELSLNPAFRRKWPSVTRTVDRFRSASSPQLAWAERVLLENELRRAVLDLLDEPARRGHWLIAVDGTPYARPHAQCLEDRSLVHRSDGTGGTPVTVGHEYSIVVAFPERARSDEPAWVLPISSRRVPTTKSPATVAAEQVFAIMDDPELAWYEQLTVVMGDSAYSTRPFLGPLAGFEHVVALTRLRSNRVFAHPPPGGSRKWFGERFALADPTTWSEPTETVQYCRVTRGGKRVQVSVQRWSDLRMRGTRRCPMHLRPFDLLRVVLADEHGVPLHARPMWLMLMGPRRSEISTSDAVDDYAQRFDQEHYHRFSRQRLLWGAFQTPEIEHEENWTMLTGLAYAKALRRPHVRHRDRATMGAFAGTRVRCRTLGHLGPARLRPPDCAVGHTGPCAQTPESRDGTLPRRLTRPPPTTLRGPKGQTGRHTPSCARLSCRLNRSDPSIHADVSTVGGCWLSKVLQYNTVLLCDGHPISAWFIRRWPSLTHWDGPPGCEPAQRMPDVKRGIQPRGVATTVGVATGVSIGDGVTELSRPSPLQPQSPS